MPHKIIIDTDVGEDIDDILAIAFALVSPEFDVLAITTVDGDTQARARIVRRLCAVVDQPEVPVAAGRIAFLPEPEPPADEIPDSVTQRALAPDERGLPPIGELGALPAHELIARLADEHPGDIDLLTIGALSNIGEAFVQHPAAMRKLRRIVSNGGQFGGEHELRIGWNLRYDPIGSGIVAFSKQPWVLLPENCTKPMTLRQEDVDRLRSEVGALPRLLCHAIDGWKRNKPDAAPTPHPSDMNVLAWLMRPDWIPTWRGLASIHLPAPGRAALSLHADDDGPHLLGEAMQEADGAELRELWMQRICGA